MQNKATLLNIILALIIVVLVYQLGTQKPEAVVKTKTSEVVAPKIMEEGFQSEKKSVGVRGHIMPKPALVIGSYSADGQPNIMTAAWAGIVNSTPMSIGVSIRSHRKSYENIMATKVFTINVPSSKFVAHMDYVGNISGHDEDKFTKLGLTPVKGEFVNAPYIKEFPIVIECEVTEMIDLGSHTQFIGKIIDTKVDAHLLDEDGHVDIEQLQPIIYEEEYYYGYGQRLAKPWDIYKLFKDGEEPTYQPVTHSNPTLATIHNRKSVRHYTSEKVTEAQLTEILKAGMAAPTAVNKQPWAFVSITDREMLDKLSVLEYAGMLKQATSAIVVCGDLDKALKGVPQEYWIQDCSAATQNILLAVESMGLGAVWTGVYPKKEREEIVRELLQLPSNIIPLNVIAIGYPTGEDTPKDKWKESNVHWNKW